MRETPVSLGVMIPVIVVILALQYLLIRIAFGTVEPRVIRGIESSLAVQIEPSIVHVWMIRRHDADKPPVRRLADSALVHLAQALFMLIFILISVANVAGWVVLAIRFAPGR